MPWCIDHREKTAAEGRALDGTLLRVPDTPATGRLGTVGTSDDSRPYPCPPASR